MQQPRFKAEAMSLPGVVRITPPFSRDQRGFSITGYSARGLAALGIGSRFVEGYTSRSKKDVLRGLHFQRAPHAQDKLVRCSLGEVYAVTADCVPSSPNYGRYTQTRLSGDDQAILFVPGNYAFGFCVVSDAAIMEYALSDFYHPESASGARWDDPALGIRWPVAKPILSQKDTQWPALS